MPSLKTLSAREERLSPGHRLCAGCGASVAVRQILMSTEIPVIVAASTGCGPRAASSTRRQCGELGVVRRRFGVTNIMPRSRASANPDGCSQTHLHRC